jgi:hypothetical protein
LTLKEYESVVADLLGTSPAVLQWSAPDVLVHGFDTNADALTISSGNFDDFSLAAQMLADGSDVSKLAACELSERADNCAKRFAASFAGRAYGRPITTAEQERLGHVFEAGAGASGYESGIRLVVEAVLMSPYFLYRIELGEGAPATGNGEVLLTAYEAASALSFALTGARPDAELIARAASDPNFMSREAIEEEAGRLLATTRSRHHIAGFLRSWLDVQDIRNVNKIPIMFPEFTLGLRVDLDDEIAAFLDYALGSGRGTLEALLGAPVAFPSAAVRSVIYANDTAEMGTPAQAKDGSLALLPLLPKWRRGVLSLGGWLAAHSPVHRSSPVDRGLAIRSRLFCQSLPPPPPGVLFSAPGAGDGNATTRQKFAQHTSDAACQSCHREMDPIGNGFEMMDAIGRRRDTENGLPVDSSGMLSGTDVDGPFEGPAELAEKLIGSRQVRDCFALQMFRYLEGRDQTNADACNIASLQNSFAPANRPIVDLALGMVLQDFFFRRSYEP